MKINKSNQGKLVNYIAGKLVKIASMDVYIQDFKYPQNLDTLSDLANDAWTKLPFVNLEEEEKKTFNAQRTPEVVTIDGLDVDSTSGTINFYTAGLSAVRVEEWLQSILKTLKDDGAEKIGAIRRERSNMFKSEVIRIPVGNIVKKEQIRPPELNMANDNARHILQKVLKYNPTDGDYAFTDIDAAGLIKRIDYYLSEKSLPQSPNLGKEEKLVPWVEGVDDPYQKIDSLMGPMKNFDPSNDTSPSLTTYHGGYDENAVRDRLQKIKNIAQWALKNGYPKISVY